MGSLSISHSVQSFSHVQLFATPWTAAQSLRKLMSIESVRSSNHLILCPPLLLLPSIFPSIRVFPNEFTSGAQSIGASAPIYKTVNSLKTECFPSQIVCIFKDWELKHEWQGTLMFQTEMLSHLCAVAFKQQSTNGWYCRHWERVSVCVCVCVKCLQVYGHASLHLRWKGLQHS